MIREMSYFAWYTSLDVGVKCPGIFIMIIVSALNTSSSSQITSDASLTSLIYPRRERLSETIGGTNKQYRIQNQFTSPLGERT
jgi:hypothetical protein